MLASDVILGGYGRACRQRSSSTGSPGIADGCRARFRWS
jgi:hypothetical protein